MKAIRSFLLIVAGTALMSSCSMFQPKYGCPNGGVGAEKVLNGEKQPKTKKFKA